MAALKITLCCLLMATGTAMAGEPAAPKETPAAKPATEATAATATADATAKTPLKKPCDQVSGTRIRPGSDRDCETSFGPNRKFTKEDIERTGQIDLAQALRMLDPIFH
jgi:hypothetical protein